MGTGRKSGRRSHRRSRDGDVVRARYGKWVLAALTVVSGVRAYGMHEQPFRQGATELAAERIETAEGSGNARPRHFAVTDTPTTADVQPGATGSSSATRLPDEAEPPDQAREEAISVVVEPGADGAYYLPGNINQQKVVCLVDTGASWIAIPDRLKGVLKLTRGRYLQVTTAGGVVGAYETIIDRLELGPLKFRNVRGVLNPKAPTDVVLLGMSALKDVKIEQSAGRLTLTQQHEGSMDAETAALPQRDSAGVLRRPLSDCAHAGQVIDRRTLDCMEGR